ncbi:MAG: YceI family protein [Caldilinea sp.]|nr:YceI family protein [Caldilinea sp.]MDW8441243.1 YceI family protein [Caldilineaceae bacterium]
MGKRSILALLFVALSITSGGALLTACQGDSNPTPTPTAASAPAAPTAEATPSTAETQTSDETQSATENAPAETNLEQSTAEQTSTEAQGSEATAEPGGPITLRFVGDGTEARFLIDEVLMGQPKTVVGVTTMVEGEITVDPANPASVQVGEIRIDARDLTTDDNRRNNRLRNDILKSNQDAYRYIIFRPTSIEGLPAAVNVGDTFNFQVIGDLTILDTTLPVTFDMSATVVDANTVRGSGSATIRYADFGIRIPSVPFVAGVSDEVRLEIDFTARR